MAKFGSDLCFPSIREAVGTAPSAGAAGSVSAPYKVAQCSSTENLNAFQQYLTWLMSVPCGPVSDLGSGEGADGVWCSSPFQFV